MSNQNRAKSFVTELSEASTESRLTQAMGFFLHFILKPLLVVISVCVWVGKHVYQIYLMLPRNALEMIFGVGLCFFGGVYFASIAAIEACRNFGGQSILDELTIVWEEATVVHEACAEDELVDENNDGVADVSVLSAREQTSRKLKVAMTAVQNPQVLMGSVQFLMCCYITVLATLKFQFAKTVAVALAIADMLSFPCVLVLGPPLGWLMGSDMKHWVPTIITTIVKIIAVCMASFIQSIISAFYSGLKGGQLFAVGLINILGEYGLMDKLPDSWVAKPFDANESFLDEFLAFPVAAAGFWFQLSNGMALPFPFDLVLFPLTIVEYLLRWEIFTG